MADRPNDQETRWLGKLKSTPGRNGKAWRRGYLVVEALAEAVQIAREAGDKYVSIKLVVLKAPDKNGNQFSIAVDDWKPNQTNQPTREPNQQPDTGHRRVEAPYIDGPEGVSDEIPL
jgi:hypothetical protein